MRNLKKPLLFSAAMLPVIVPAVILTAFYQMQLYPADIIAAAENQPKTYLGTPSGSE